MRLTDRPPPAAASSVLIRRPAPRRAASSSDARGTRCRRRGCRAPRGWPRRRCTARRCPGGAVAIERRVAAAVDDAAAAGRDAHPVAVAPDAGVHVEVAVVVAAAVGVAPEVERHRRHRLHAAPARPPRRSAACRASSHTCTSRAEAAALHLAGHVGSSGVPPRKALATSVPPEITAQTRRGRTCSCPQTVHSGESGEPVQPRRTDARDVARLARLDAVLQAAGVVGRAGAEGGDPEIGGEALHQRVARRDRRGCLSYMQTVVPRSSAEIARFHITQPELLNQAKRSSPAAIGRDGRLQVEVEAVQLELLEEHAAVTVHDRLRQAGGAAAVDDPQRMLEGHRARRDAHRPRGSAFDQRSTLPAQPRASNAALDLGAAVSRYGMSTSARGSAARRAARRTCRAVCRLAAVHRAVDGDEHLRRDLRKRSRTVGTPMSVAHMLQMAPRRGAGEERDDGLGEARQVRRDAIALLRPRAPRALAASAADA